MHASLRLIQEWPISLGKNIVSYPERAYHHGLKLTHRRNWIMTTKTGTTILTVALLALSLTCRAEYRTWKDNEGRKIQAELIQNVDGSVSLRTEQKKLLHVSISTLSAADQEYVLSLTPPHFDIDVQELTDTHSSAFDIGDGDDRRGDDNDANILNRQTEIKATLTKESMRAYKGTMSAELYVIGSKSISQEFVLINKTVVKVSFEKDMDNKFVFTSGNVDFRELEAGASYGMQYAGYLLVMLDGSGKVFEEKSNHSELKEHMAMIRKLSQGSVIKLPVSSSFE
jgi:hypothetical protein